MQTMHHWKNYLNLIWSFYTQDQVQGPRKKARTNVQVKNIKLRLFKNLFFTFKSKCLCCALESKIIKTCVSRKEKFNVIKACKNLVIWLDGSMMFFCLSSIEFPKGRQIRFVALRLCHLQCRKSLSFISLSKHLSNMKNTTILRQYKNNQKLKNKLVSLNIKVLPISSRGQMGGSSFS